MDTVIFIAVTIIFLIVAATELFVFQKNVKAKKELTKIEKETKSKMYEISILNELSDKVGYSLDVENIIETITSSLRDFIDYSTISYMLLLPEKIVFRSYLEKPISHKFVSDVREKMLGAMSEYFKTDFSNKEIEETLWGAKSSDQVSESDELVGSFFNIPLVISEKTVGVLTIADTRKNFYSQEETVTLNNIVEQATKAVTRLQMVVESENSKLNAMVSSMADGVVMTDKDYRVAVVNPSAKKALGLEEKNNLSLLDFTEGLGGKIDLKDKVEESIKLDKIFLSEEISLQSGFFKIVVAPVRDNWKSLGSVIVFRDITHEKEVEKIKEDFTSMIVHELRSPLDSIKKMTELMRTTEVKKAKSAECLQMIYSSSYDMLELINNLLDIAKIEAGKFELTKQKSDIKKIIESRILFFDVAAKDAKVKIKTQFGQLPDTVEFDPHTVSQVLNNLISNAIKFTKENGNITIQAIFHKKGESLLKEAESLGINWFIKKEIANLPDSLFVAVTDNGIGINSEQISKLFNKFSQAKNVFVEKGGTGLGLAIIKSIIDSHGGVVGAESVEGQGSTFYFTLPV